MGYYITFVFDPEKDKFDREKLTEKFMSAGASFMEDPYYNEGGLLIVAGYPLSIGDYPVRALRKGFYADLRFSWGTDVMYLLEKLTMIVDVADKVGCKVYDGQLDLWITRKNLRDIVEGFTKSARSVGNLFGAADENKYRAAVE